MNSRLPKIIVLTEQETTENLIAAWIYETDTHLDEISERLIRVEIQLEADLKETHEIHKFLKAHEMRFIEVDKKLSAQDGGIRMLQLVGSIIGGLVLIGHLIIMILT